MTTFPNQAPAQTQTPGGFGSPAPAQDPNDFLMGGGDGIPSAKFPEPGSFIEGPIVGGPKAYQEREYNKQTQRSDGPPRTFPSGDPIMGLSIDVQTPYIDPMIEGDTGVRRVYIQGKLMKQAVREGILAAGGKGLETGGYIRLDFTHRDDPMDKGSAKNWACQYRTAANQQLMGGGAPAQAPQPVAQAAPAAAPQYAQQAAPAAGGFGQAAPPAQQALPVQQAPAPAPAAPVQQAAPQAAPAGDPVALARQLIAAQVPDAGIAAATGLDVVVIQAIRNAG